MADDAAEFMRKMAGLGKAMRDAQPRIVLGAAKKAEARYEKAAIAAAGPDRKFSNLGKAKAVLSAQSRLRESGAEPTAAIEAKGPWGITDSNYDAYVITPKTKRITGKGAKAARAARAAAIGAGGRHGQFSGLKPLAIGGNTPRFVARRKAHRSANHWNGATPEATRIASRELGIGVTKIIADHLGG
jgi:hypothetical protein